jgi:hypothetical protein
MTTFHEFLRGRLQHGGFSTEDTLASFLPLARQVAEAHAAGLVAPLDGLSALQVEGVRIWFHDEARREPSRRPEDLALVDPPRAGGWEVISERRWSVDADGHACQEADLAVGGRDEPITRPCHLPGYRSWEHLLGHHDPLTDVYSLGLLLASLACGLDLSDRESLERFASHRRNPFRLNPRLHPVVAKAVVKMTELSRHARPQDLATLVHHLEHHRDQDVDLDLEVASAEASGAGERQPVILGKLRERLFEISRRNRLLHFRSTLGSVNLTQASVPLSFDARNIRPEQILTWGGDFARDLSAGVPVSLNRHLDFAEQLYLPSVLDRLRSDAQRDTAEFGFEQLRLAICFLRWTNLKETPAEHYDSPLVLLPVRLLKKKGVRDTYVLQPMGTEAEVNPVVRYLFGQLHGIELPATLDLAETTLDTFHEDLAARVAASEPGITLRKIDRPRVELVHELAQRRLDRWLRSARPSGKGVRTFLGLDYSYDPGNFSPLGLALFRARVMPRSTPLRRILEGNPLARSWAVPPAQQALPAPGGERQLHTLREAEDDNPYHWDLDLCRVTLGNFKYRKMALVRDYSDLLQTGSRNGAFDAVFSLAPREVQPPTPPPPALEERFHVMPCDPTQAAAIGLARAGASYVVQGPPGTGKSQTITNLIADYVARGKRVLFVCEKRAAIDVVHARLRQQGLQSLCCLIHDSQVDKKAFIEDLKQTYEGLLAERPGSARAWRTRRAELVEALRRELVPLERFDRAMRTASPTAGVPLRTVLERAAELLAERPPLSAAQREALPGYAEWTSCAETLSRLAPAIAHLRPDGVFARHPLHLLAPAVIRLERTREHADALLADAREALVALISALEESGGLARGELTLDDALALVDWAAHVEWLSQRDLLGLLDERSQARQRFELSRREVAAAQRALATARQETGHWTRKLSPGEVTDALAQATALEGRWSSVLRPSFWRLGRLLRSRYRFSRHAAAPRWSEVLAALADEYAADDALAEAERAARVRLSVEEPLHEIAERLEVARAAVERLPRSHRPLHEAAVRTGARGEAIAALAEAVAPARRLRDGLGEVLIDFAALPLDVLEESLSEAKEALGDLPAALGALELVARLPPRLATAIRTLPLTLREIEAAVAGHCVDQILGSDLALHQFDAATRERHLQQIEKLSRTWQEANAGAVLERAREIFLEHLRLSSLPPSQLTLEQKQVEATYRRGRRDLEHELGKAGRHRSIRDLVAGDSGPVVFDLKPVWLMSPLSVSDTLPLRPDAFDVVIFDEASQIPLESAVPSIFRAPQAIVVGDEMQLPPTDFFSARAPDHEEDGDTVLSEDGRRFEYDLSANSFLDHAAKNLPARMLGWHYRSRSESLIAFSNWAFYQGRLLTVPENRPASAGQDEIVARSPGDGDANAGRVLDRPMAFHLVEGAVYEHRRNRAEAEYVAHLVRGLLAAPERRSIGIVAFSEAQQGEIESALQALARQDRRFAERLEAEQSREEGGQFVGLLVRNLENIQGDERDVVILSVCYGPAPDGKVRMSFGPINQSGGGRRLNVAFSRARHHMCVVSSIRHGQVTSEHNDGASCLRSYLRYAEAASAGDSAGARRVLHELAAWRDLEEKPEAKHDAVVTQIAAALTQRGYEVELGVGLSHFRCDLATRRRGEAGYRLGILVDTEAHYRQDDLFERDLLRPGLLRAFGWQVAHVLASDWYRDRRAVLGRLVRLLERGGALRPAPAARPAT